MPPSQAYQPPLLNWRNAPNTVLPRGANTSETDFVLTRSRASPQCVHRQQQEQEQAFQHGEGADTQRSRDNLFGEPLPELWATMPKQQDAREAAPTTRRSSQRELLFDDDGERTSSRASSNLVDAGVESDAHQAPHPPMLKRQSRSASDLELQCNLDALESWKPPVTPTQSHATPYRVDEGTGDFLELLGSGPARSYALSPAVDASGYESLDVSRCATGTYGHERSSSCSFPANPSPHPQEGEAAMQQSTIASARAIIRAHRAQAQSNVATNSGWVHPHDCARASLSATSPQSSPHVSTAAVGSPRPPRVTSHSHSRQRHGSFDDRAHSAFELLASAPSSDIFPPPAPSVHRPPMLQTIPSSTAILDAGDNRAALITSSQPSSLQSRRRATQLSLSPQHQMRCEIPQHPASALPHVGQHHRQSLPAFYQGHQGHQRAVSPHLMQASPRDYRRHSQPHGLIATHQPFLHHHQQQQQHHQQQQRQSVLSPSPSPYERGTGCMSSYAKIPQRPHTANGHHGISRRYRTSAPAAPLFAAHQRHSTTSCSTPAEPKRSRSRSSIPIIPPHELQETPNGLLSSSPQTEDDMERITRLQETAAANIHPREFNQVVGKDEVGHLNSSNLSIPEIKHALPAWICTEVCGIKKKSTRRGCRGKRKNRRQRKREKLQRRESDAVVELDKLAEAISHTKLSEASTSSPATPLLVHPAAPATLSPVASPQVTRRPSEAQQQEDGWAEAGVVVNDEEMAKHFQRRRRSSAKLLLEAAPRFSFDFSHTTGNSAEFDDSEDEDADAADAASDMAMQSQRVQRMARMEDEHHRYTPSDTSSDTSGGSRSVFASDCDDSGSHKSTGSQDDSRPSSVRSDRSSEDSDDLFDDTATSPQGKYQLRLNRAEAAWGEIESGREDELGSPFESLGWSSQASISSTSSTPIHMGKADLWLPRQEDNLLAYPM